MNRFKRIAHGGWLGRFLSVVTRGYYPYVDELAVLVGAYGSIQSPAWTGNIAGPGFVAAIQESDATGLIASVAATGSVVGPFSDGSVGRM
jgi:hypothetical protein